MKKLLIFYITYLFLSTITFGQTLKDTVVDIDGNVYHTVKIGTQIWMVENLKVTHYNNGDSIPNITASMQWCQLKTGAYCSYDNLVSYADSFGQLYNWFAINDKRNICPVGWHVPSDSEWNTMELFLDSSVDTSTTGWTGTDIGSKLKKSGTKHWTWSNVNAFVSENTETDATNISGFSGLPSGYRTGFDEISNKFGSSFSKIESCSIYWTASEYDTSDAWMRYIGNKNSQIIHNIVNKTFGYSIRCVKN